MSQNKYLNQLLDDVGAGGPYPNTNKQKERAVQSIISHNVRFRKQRDVLYLWEGSFQGMFNALRIAGIERKTLDGNHPLCVDYANWIKTELIANKDRIFTLEGAKADLKYILTDHRARLAKQDVLIEELKLELERMRIRLSNAKVES